MKITFNNIEIDRDNFSILRDGKQQAAEPLLFDLLVYFASNPQKLLSKDELMKAVWGGRIVSDATIASAVKNVRKLIGDSGQRQSCIKTVHGRGFQFVAELAQPLPSSASGELTANSGQANSDRANSEQLSSDIAISVMVARNTDLGPGVKPIASDIAMGVEVMLSRIPLLKIRAQGRQYTIGEPMPSAKSIYSDTGVQYIAFLNIQQNETANIVNAQLVDAEAELILWSQQFQQSAVESGAVSGSLSSNIASNLASSLVTQIVAKFEPQLTKAIYARVKGHNDNNGSHNGSSQNNPSNARALFLQASTLLSVKSWHAKTFIEATELLKRSEALDPSFALAPAYLALVLALGHRIGLLSDSEANIAEATAAIERAVALDNSDSVVLGFCGCALSDIGVFARAKSMLRKALNINENNAQAWIALGSAHLFEGDYKQSIEALNHGIAISPLDNRLSIWNAALASAHFRSKNLEQAVVAGELACDSDDNAYLPRVILAAIYFVMGRQRNVLETLADAYRIKPDLSQLEISQLVGPKLSQQLVELSTQQ